MNYKLGLGLDIIIIIAKDKVKESNYHIKVIIKVIKVIIKVFGKA